MKLPNQSRPVMRKLITTASVYSPSGVSPLGDCPRGQWCCKPVFGGPSKCEDCRSKDPIFGFCLAPQVAECALHAAVPAHDCP